MSEDQRRMTRLVRLDDALNEVARLEAENERLRKALLQVLFLQSNLQGDAQGNTLRTVREALNP